MVFQVDNTSGKSTPQNIQPQQGTNLRSIFDGVAAKVEIPFLMSVKDHFPKADKTARQAIDLEIKYFTAAWDLYKLTKSPDDKPEDFESKKTSKLNDIEKIYNELTAFYKANPGLENRIYVARGEVSAIQAAEREAAEREKEWKRLGMPYTWRR